MIEWREVARKPGLVALAAPGVSLILESPRGGAIDPQLADVIARLAPHISFGELVTRGELVERSAIVGDDRMTIGRYQRGAISIAYLVTTRVPAGSVEPVEPIEIDSVITAHIGDVRSPFEHLAD